MSLDLWPAEPETIGTVGTSKPLELGMGHAGQSIKLAADALGDLGLDLLGLCQGLESLSVHTPGLGIVCPHLLQALLVLVGKAQVLHEFGVLVIERLMSSLIFDATIRPFWEMVVHSAVLGLGICAL